MKNASSKNIERELRSRGWTISRKGGDHIVYGKDGRTISITSPYINKMVERRLMKQITGGTV